MTTLKKHLCVGTGVDKYMLKLILLVLISNYIKKSEERKQLFRREAQENVKGWCGKWCFVDVRDGKSQSTQAPFGKWIAYSLDD